MCVRVFFVVGRIVSGSAVQQNRLRGANITCQPTTSLFIDLSHF